MVPRCLRTTLSFSESAYLALLYTNAGILGKRYFFVLYCIVLCFIVLYRMTSYRNVTYCIVSFRIESYRIIYLFYTCI